VIFPGKGKKQLTARPKNKGLAIFLLLTRFDPTILPERDGPSGGQQGGNSLRHGAIETPAQKKLAFKPPHDIFAKSESNGFARVALGS